MRITSEQNKKLQEIGGKYEIRFIILHGSYAKNNPRRGSDLDIAILGRRPIDFDTQLEIFGELEGVFGNSKERELDLKTLHGIDPLFRYEVVKDGNLLYGDRNDYDEFRAYAFRDFMDSADLRQLESQIIAKKQKILTKRYT